MASPPPTHTSVTVRPALDAADMAAILAIRHQVFVSEQGVATNVGNDAQDRNAYHVVGLVNGQVVGAGRVAITNREGQIAWVAVLPEYRRLSVGRAIMQELIRYADEIGVNVLLLNAQTHARRFYRHLGFRPVGDVFIMGGIEHQLMSRVRE